MGWDRIAVLSLGSNSFMALVRSILITCEEFGIHGSEIVEIMGGKDEKDIIQTYTAASL